MTSDPISDLLTRIRNAALARHETTHVPASKVKMAIAELLKREGFLLDVNLEKWGPQQREAITITLKYGRDRRAAFEGIKRISRPGRRVYVGYRDIPRVLSGLGVTILSTSRGMMTDKDARRHKVGGEIVCEVW
jgi:small subunit ribosomal protein S8